MKINREALLHDEGSEPRPTFSDAVYLAGLKPLTFCTEYRHIVLTL
jgi:hypothetical protein